MSTNYHEFDSLDKRVAELLMEDASITSQQLGEKIALSSSAANERVRRLKQNGVIKKIAAVVDSNFLDMALGAFIFVTLDDKHAHQAFLSEIESNDSILECHHMTGDYSYLLKVRCKDTKALESIITDFLKDKCGVTKSQTQIILSSHKDQGLIV